MNKGTKWIIGILAVALAIVSFLLWDGSRNYDQLMVDAESRANTNDSLKRSAAFRDSADDVRDAAVHFHDSVQSRKLDSALHLLAASKDSLKTVKRTLQRAVENLGSVIADSRDTTLQHKFDSVSRALDDLYAVGGSVINNSDTSIKILMDMLDYKDSVNAVLNLEVKDLKASLTSCLINFDGLKTDFDKVAAKQKRQNLFAKIGAGLSTVLGIVIGHSIK